MAGHERVAVPQFRDTRFSDDKTPLKTNVAATFPHRALGRMNGASFYFEIGPDYVWIGGGVYRPDTSQLHLLREHIAANHRRFDAIVKTPAFKKLGGLKGDKLTRVPRGFDKEHPAAGLPDAQAVHGIPRRTRCLRDVEGLLQAPAGDVQDAVADGEVPERTAVAAESPARKAHILAAGLAGFAVVDTCGDNFDMEPIGIRELKNNLSHYVRKVESGQRISVTAHGRVVAELVPPGSRVTAKRRREQSRYEQLVADGVVRPAVETGDPFEGHDLEPLMAPGEGQALLDWLRGDK